jgi:hypothetical protein
MMFDARDGGCGVIVRPPDIAAGNTRRTVARNQ